jgi:uncharacterized protein
LWGNLAEPTVPFAQVFLNNIANCMKKYTIWEQKFNLLDKLVHFDGLLDCGFSENDIHPIFESMNDLRKTIRHRGKMPFKNWTFPFNRWRLGLVVVCMLCGCRSYDNALLDAVRKQEIGSVQRMLEGGARANEVPLGESEFPIEAAAKGGGTEIVRMLLAHGAHPDSARGDRSPLWWAIINGHEAAAILLVEAKAKLDGPLIKGVAPFYAAVMQDFSLLVPKMIAQGAEVNAPGPAGSPLHEAAENGNLAMTKLLIEKGAQVNRVNDLGESPVYLALENAHPDLAAFLAESGADLNLADKLGNTPLHALAAANRAGLIAKACGLGANPNGQNLLGETPLHIAAAHSLEQVASVLIDSCGANMNLQEIHGLSPAGLAYREGQSDMVEFLTARGGRLR